jgi:hypothetical protein
MNGWDCRQATLQLCVFADGIQRSRPLLIFHRAEEGDSRRRVEERQYHQDVDILFNPTAWATPKTMLYWIQHSYRICSLFSFGDIEPKLLAIDAFRAHNAAEVMAAFKNLKTTVSLIPGGCTGFVQILDVALTLPMKMHIKQEADDHYDAHISHVESRIDMPRVSMERGRTLSRQSIDLKGLRSKAFWVGISVLNRPRVRL